MKKPKFISWLQEKWENCSDSTKGLITGAIAGAVGATTGCILAGRHKEEAWIQASNDICDEESKAAYQRGLRDGEMHGYYKLLTDPDSAFRKMGMEPKHF